jgi:hypothetical protein
VTGASTGRCNPPILRGMPPSFRPLPPDDPIFTIGPSLVFRSDLPHVHDEEERDDDPDREDVEDCRVPGNTEIENYEPSDEGWGIVVGPFMRPTPEHDTDERDADAPADEDSE